MSNIILAQETEEVILKRKEKAPAVSTILPNEIPRVIHKFNEPTAESFSEPNKNLRVSFVVNKNLNDSLILYPRRQPNSHMASLQLFQVLLLAESYPMFLLSR